MHTTVRVQNKIMAALQKGSFFFTTELIFLTMMSQKHGKLWENGLQASIRPTKENTVL